MFQEELSSVVCHLREELLCFTSVPCTVYSFVTTGDDSLHGDDDSATESDEDNGSVFEGIEEDVKKVADACESPSSPLGHSAKFAYPLLKRHKCPICLFAMRNPVQTECGHLFCKGCLEAVLKRK